MLAQRRRSDRKTTCCCALFQIEVRLKLFAARFLTKNGVDATHERVCCIDIDRAYPGTNPGVTDAS